MQDRAHQSNFSKYLVQTSMNIYSVSLKVRLQNSQRMDTTEYPVQPRTSADRSPAFITDNVYLLRHGYFYARRCQVSAIKARFFAVIVLAQEHAEFDVTLAGCTSRHGAVALKPPAQRHMGADGARLISFHANSLHPAFRAFSQVPEPGVLPLDRKAFAALDEALQAAHAGRLSIEAATELHDSVFSIASRCLPEPDPIDSRVQRLVELLEENPAYSLEELAGMVRLSYKRVSYLFAKMMGLPLRSYLLWKKIHRYMSLAGSGASRTMTDLAHAAGFTDSAHLCRTFHEAFGVPPSYFFAGDRVRLKSWLCGSGSIPARTQHASGIDSLAAPLDSSCEIHACAQPEQRLALAGAGMPELLP